MYPWAPRTTTLEPRSLPEEAVSAQAQYIQLQTVMANTSAHSLLVRFMYVSLIKLQPTSDR